MLTMERTHVQAMSGSCPQCLGDLAVQPSTGGVALACIACGMVVSSTPSRKVESPSPP
jgi:hypothetical protein